MKRLLDYSVRVTNKNLTVEYNSLEEASEATGLSIQALKIRANKNSVPKDGICVEWIDEHTKRSMKASQSKRKGNGYELKIIKELTNLGFNGLRSSRNESKLLDNNKVDIADPLNVLSCYIQCKRTKNTPNIEAISEGCNLKDKPLVVFWSKESDNAHNKEYVMVPKEYFYKLLKNE